jgi:O-antigen/teichoic acid export membrane protein
MSLEETLAVEQQSDPGLPAMELAGYGLTSAGGLPVDTTSVAAVPAIHADGSSVVPVSWTERLLAALSGGGTFRKSMLALTDQGIVSAVNFLTMVLLRRSVVGSTSTAQQELGIYQLGFSVVLLATCAQNELLATPYAVFGNRVSGNERKQYAGSTLLHQAVLSILLSGLLLFVGAGLTLGWGSEHFGNLQWILAIILPFILAREFVRRIAFAHLQMVAALLLDATVAVLQLGGLWALKLSGHMTAGMTFCATGVACALTAAVALYMMRGHFTFRGGKTWHDLRLNWSFGKWSFAAQAVHVAMSYGLSWMLAFLAGSNATGRFAACMSVVLITNPILIGLNNFMTPKAINVYHSLGINGLRQLTRRFTILMIVFVGSVAIVLALFGTRLVGLLYGDPLTGEQWVVPFLAIGVFVLAASLGAENGLTALCRPDRIFLANAIALPIMICCGAVLILRDGVSGAAFAALIGTLVATVLKVKMFAVSCRAETNKLRVSLSAPH